MGGEWFNVSSLANEKAVVSMAAARNGRVFRSVLAGVRQTRHALVGPALLYGSRIACHTYNMDKSILVRVTTNVVISGNYVTAHWVVAVDDAQVAVQIVREQVAVAAYLVEATDVSVPEETIKRIGLAPGQAIHL
jgi:hypothetical protein